MKRERMSKKKAKLAPRAPAQAKASAKRRGLTPREEIFALQYAGDPNGTRAAIRAGYSKWSAGVIATRLFRKVKVQARIASLQKKTEEKRQLSRERLVLELVRLAYSSILDVIEQREPGKAIRFRDLKNVPPWAAAAIQAARRHSSKWAVNRRRMPTDRMASILPFGSRWVRPAVSS
jgi:hypothetical protein